MPEFLFAAESATEIVRGGNYSGYFLKMVISMLLILGLLAVLAWYVKRFGIGNFSAKSDENLKIVSMLSLGSRERLVMLQVGDEQVLLGLTPGKIKKLHSKISPIKENTHAPRKFSTALSGEIEKSGKKPL